MNGTSLFGRIGAAILLGAPLAATVLTAPAAWAEDYVSIVSPYQTTTLDPMRSAVAGNTEVFGQLYARLVLLDRATGALGPGLATHWEVSEDQRLYTFHLRDAVFSDGSPITAEDVAFSLSRIHSDPMSAYPAPLAAVETITATGPRTIEIRLSAPSSPFLGNLEIWNMGIVSKADVEKRGAEVAFVSGPVTSGPYKVREWRPNEKLVLEPNPRYWRAGYPKSDTVFELREVSSPITRTAMLITGEADVVRDVPWTQIGEFDDQPQIELRAEPARTIHVVLLNHKRAPFSDVKAREAAALALDREGMNRAITGGIADLANTTLPNTLDYHDDAAQGYAYNPRRARELLAEAGMIGQKVKILADGGATGQQTALFIQAQWKAVGFDPEIVNVDPGAWWGATFTGDYDATATWWYNETADPDLAVRWALCGSCGSNAFNTFYDNPKVDALTEAGTKESDPAKRAAIYREIQTITTREVSQIPMFSPPNMVAYSRRIEGLSLTPAIQWTLEDVTIAK